MGKKNVIQLIKQLRQETGLGIIECKEALEAVDYNVEAAKIYLRKKGAMKSKDRGHRPATEGYIGTYIHTGNRIAVLVEVNCETDFASRSAEMQVFALNLAMHIAASNPKWVKREDVPTDILDQEMDILSSALGNKPAEIKEKIIVGKMDKFYKDNCLLDQSYVRDPKLTISDLVEEFRSKVKENVVVKKFSRFEVGA